MHTTAQNGDSESINWATLDPDEFAEKITALAETKGPALTVQDMDAVERIWKRQMPMRLMPYEYLYFGLIVVYLDTNLDMRQVRHGKSQLGQQR